MRIQKAVIGGVIVALSLSACEEKPATVESILEETRESREARDARAEEERRAITGGYSDAVDDLIEEYLDEDGQLRPREER